MRLRKHAAAVLFFLVILSPGARGTEVAICTDLGAITIELYDEQAPQQAANFLRYVEHGFYSGTVFHRVVDGFVVQAGGLNRKLAPRETLAPVVNESHNGLKNVRGSLAAARTDEPDSARSQFFINLADNAKLDATEREPGFTVFAHVTAGMDVVDAIGALPTGAAGPLEGNVPDPLVAIESAAIIDRSALDELPEDSRAQTIEARISAAAAANDTAGTLHWVQQYRAICGPPDPYLLLIEANAAVASGDHQRAAYVLEDYFAIADPTHPSYSSAQGLARNLEPGSEPSINRLLAHCEAPPLPELPDGSVDSLERMIDGQTRVRDFMSASEMYLDCLSEVIDRRGLTSEQHTGAVLRHNDMVTTMEDLAERFNAQVRAFKERK